MLTPAQCTGIPLHKVRFRALQAEDYDEVVALHTEWFPVSYDEAFYTKSVKGEIFTIAATYPAQAACSSSAPGAADDGGEEGEHLLGIITMSTTCDLHSEDIVHILGADCEVLCGGGEIAESGAVSPSAGCLAYILTLGVIDGFRRRGLASELLRLAIIHVQRRMAHVQAVYLHVVTYNEAAIRLYEAMHFLRIGHFPSFYQLHGKPYDSFLYALYVHTGRPPWKWRLKHFLGLAPGSTSWKEWMSSVWSSLWRGDALKPHPDDAAATQGDMA